MDRIIISIKEFLYANIGGDHQAGIVTALLLVAILLAAVVAYYICKWLLYLLGIAIDKTPTKWDDDLLDHHFMRAVSQLAPALVVNRMLPAFFRANGSD